MIETPTRSYHVSGDQTSGQTIAMARGCQSGLLQLIDCPGVSPSSGARHEQTGENYDRDS